MKLYNSLSRKVEEFKPFNPPEVGLYTCGPTVYDYAHIGHMRRYVGDDILVRVLTYLSYKVIQVMNITDVGHLTSDADEGEDKIEKGARKMGKTVWGVAKFFEKQFFNSTKALNIKKPTIVCYATKHINEQINLIKKLEKKGFTYKTELGVYFEISKFPNYTRLSQQKLEDLKMGVRENLTTDSNKRYPADFALWLFTKGRFKNHIMRWKSPWGEGFPGWHIECSAMSMKYLGESIDIHTGGIDHIKVHHANEIAQSEAATGKKPFVKYWIHHGFLQIEGRKMSKSLGNLYTVEDIVKKGFDPMALRYLYLTGHYRQSLNFTWESLKKAKQSYQRLLEVFNSFGYEKATDLSQEAKELDQKFNQALENDLQMPEALAVVWETARSDLKDQEKRALLLDWNKILGLGFASRKKEVSLSEKEKELLKQRKKAREKKDWPKADEIRKRLEKKGLVVKDTSQGPMVKRR